MLESLFGQGSFLPHGYCFTWTPGLLWTFVGADGFIAGAYFSIPVALWRFASQRRDRSLNWIYGLFGAFIFACGTTHVMDIWTIWRPDYGLQALSKTVTAVISVLTAIALWPLVPRALKIPSVQQLQDVIRDLQTEIARRQAAEEQAHESEQSLMSTLVSIDAGFLATDRSGRITAMNPVAERVTGWSREQAMGVALREVWQREDLRADQADRNPVDLALELGLTAHVPQLVEVTSRGGDKSPLVVRASVLMDKAGQVRGMALVFRDRSELVHARAETARLAAIVASSTDAIIGQTLTGQITDWNEGADALFGYSAEEALGQPVQMLVPPERLDEERPMQSRLARGDRIAPFDTVRRTKSGASVDVSLSVSPIRDASGRVVGAATIARDISAQRSAESALRASEARLRFVLDAAQLGEWEVDLASGHTVRSWQHDRCFGYAERQQEWGFARFEQHVHPDDRADVSRSYQAAVQHRTPWRCQCRVVWPDQTTHWLSIHGALQYEGERAVRLLGLVFDISREKLAEEARRIAERLEGENRRIEAANRAKSEFLANMSHELRTPLNAIIGFADLLASGMVPAGSTDQAKFAGHIATSGKHLLQLINDVLDLSKVEAGKFEFRPVEVDLQALVHHVVDVLGLNATRQQLRIEVDIDPGLGPLHLDADRLKQVLYNFVSNAIKFTPAGGTITIRAAASGAEHFRLEVHDTGIGISREDLPRLFSDFVQLSAGATKAHQGTGLGLALTRRLVQAQGGRVGVRSTPGTGSVFWALLNRVHGTDTVNVFGEAVEEIPLLLVQESGQVQRAVAATLSDSGFRVEAVDTGEEAVYMARLSDYSAIALSLSLPGQSGLATLGAIRSDASTATHHAPVLGLSMTPLSSDPVNFAVADVLAKPIDARQAVVVIRRLTAGLREPGRVLVIDDDPIALDLMGATLLGLGLQPIAHTDAQEALARLDEHRPHLIVLDLVMPGFDGFDVLDALSRHARWRSTPVVVWTSMALADMEIEQLSRSARAIVAKGGGGLDVMLHALARWRGALAQPIDDR